MTGYFITASDTGVGKTWITCQLAGQLLRKGASLRVRKPIESGCSRRAGQLYPADGDMLYQANHCRENLQTVTPYRFEAALAPDRAALLEGQQLSVQQLVEACLQNVSPNDHLLVEGAGGFFSPICHDGLNADLAKALGLRVIVVCADRLGAINQALLTLAAVEHSGLEVQAIILNQVESETVDSGLDNYNDLLKHCSVPVYSCGYEQQLEANVI
jgi:dethiobiotin synthetase